MNQRDLCSSAFALKQHPNNMLIYLDPSFYSTPPADTLLGMEPPFLIFIMLHCYFVR